MHATPLTTDCHSMTFQDSQANRDTQELSIAVPGANPRMAASSTGALVWKDAQLKV